MPTVYNKVTKDGTTLIDLSQDTVDSAADIVAGKTGHLNDGSQVTGTASIGVDIPVFTGEYDESIGDITAITCNKTFAECYAAYNNFISSAILESNGSTETLSVMSATSSQITYVVIYGVTPSIDIVYHSDNTITFSSPSAYSSTLEATANGYYHMHNYGVYESVTVNVPGPTGSINISTNGTHDVTNYASAVVNVPSGGSSKNVQTEQSTARYNSTVLASLVSLTCSTAGIYDVYWSCARSNTSQTWGSQLFINGTAYGTENKTWSNHVQNNHLSNVQIPANATVTVYGRSRSGYFIYVPQLTIVQIA